ncbi:MAG: OB-fold domain-containing protein [Novosphingobium sp.]|nr:OB-fold domain-containing protein [Novosphingobium sp.]
MADNAVMTHKPGHKVIRIADSGEPFVEAFRCADCGAVFPDHTLACRKCGSRDGVAPFRSLETGRLYSWSIVHRSYPGITVPFVSAIVDLDGGLALKGTLRDADEADLREGLPVRLVFDDAGGARDKNDVPYVGFHFVPAGDA